MATSRVEKFKEYRKSIINDDNRPLKTMIDTDIKAGASTGETLISEADISLLKKIYRRRNAVNITYFVSVFLVITTLVVFGIILF